MTRETRTLGRSLLALLIVSWVITHLWILLVAVATFLTPRVVRHWMTGHQRRSRHRSVSEARRPDDKWLGDGLVHVRSARPIPADHAPQPDDFDVPDVQMTWWCANTYHEDCSTYLRLSLESAVLMPCECGCHAEASEESRELKVLGPS